MRSPMPGSTISSVNLSRSPSWPVTAPAFRSAQADTHDRHGGLAMQDGHISGPDGVSLGDHTIPVDPESVARSLGKRSVVTMRAPRRAGQRHGVDGVCAGETGERPT